MPSPPPAAIMDTAWQRLVFLRWLHRTGRLHDQIRMGAARRARGETGG